MLALIISVMVGGSAYAYAHEVGEVSTGWSIGIGVGAAILLQIIISLLVRKKIQEQTNGVQNIILEGQNKIRRRINQFQTRPQGSMQAMQKIIEKDQCVLIEKALEKTKDLEPFFKWNVLLNKQVNTMRMQFYFQLKQYDQVDALLPKSFFVDPMSTAIKITRQYKTENPKLEKTLKQSVRKFKGDKSVMLYALYSWILVKEKKIDEAIQVLNEAKGKTDHEVILQNWEHLVNGRVKKFSNAGLGDEWYALYLENPKPVKQKQRQKRTAGSRPF